AERGENVLRRVLTPRPVPPPHEIARSAVAAVEPLGVAANEPVHAIWERPRGDVHDGVPVRRQQADRDAPPLVTRDRRNEEPKRGRAIQVVLEVMGRTRSTYAEMTDARREVAWRAGHAAQGRGNTTRSQGVSYGHGTTRAMSRCLAPGHASSGR